MNLSYQAYNRAGEVVSGNIAAPSEAAATEALFKDGLFVIAFGSTPKCDRTEVGARPPVPRRFMRRTGGLRETAALARQLALLASTGTTIVQALGAAERQLPSGPWRNTVTDVRRRIEEGESMSLAMQHHALEFPAVFRSLIAAGEAGGQLSAMLTRIAEMMRRQLRIRQSIMSALAYPALLITISVFVLITMLTTVLPRFAGLFDSLDAPLPASTAVLLDVGTSMRMYWWAWCGGVLVLAASLAAALRSSTGRMILDRAALSIPVISRVVIGLMLARMARTLGTLLDSRVPLLDALALTRDACPLGPFASLLRKAEESVAQGESLSAVLRSAPFITPAVYESTLTGERTGRLGQVLSLLADSMDEDNEVMVKSLMSLLEPIILSVLGLIIGGVALSMFLPLFDLTSAVGQTP